MRFPALITAFLVLLAAAAAPRAQARVTCDSGTTVAAAGKLRIFGVHFNHPDTDESGYTEYACLGGRGRPLQVGDDSGNTGTGADYTLRYVYAGGRYLAGLRINEGEGGGDVFYDVFDLQARHRFAFADDGPFYIEDDGPRFRLGAQGTLVSYDEARPRAISRGGHARVLADAGSDVAVAGTTVYWTAGGAAQSSVLAGPPSDAQDTILEPWEFGKSRCRARGGTTIARSGRVRVARRGGKLFACRVGSRAAVRLPSHLKALRITGDDWLSGVDTCSHTGLVVDMRSRRVVTQVTMEAGWPSTLLPDGTLAWIDDTGALRAQAPDTAESQTLEAAGASALASSGRTVYWTAGGAAHRWTAPPSAHTPMAGSWTGCT